MGSRKLVGFELAIDLDQKSSRQPKFFLPAHSRHVMLASLLWAVGPVHFDEAKVPKQVHMWYDKPNGFFTTTDYFNTCAALRNSPLAAEMEIAPPEAR